MAAISFSPLSRAIRRLCCPIYTRVSTDAQPEQGFNSLAAQREA
jgi:hypothetical protein